MSSIEAVRAARALRGLSWSDTTDDQKVDAMVADAGAAGRPLVNTALYSPRGCGPGAAQHGLAVFTRPFGRQDSAPGSAGESEGAAEADRGLVGADEVRRLRSHRCVTVDERSWDTPYAAATVVIDLCCAGVPVLTRELSAAVRAMVDPGLLSLADEVSEQAVAEPGQREALSIGVRRQAHRTYGFHPLGDPPFPTVSIVVAAGPDQAPGVLEQVADQSWPHVHVHHAGLDADPHEVVQEVRDTGAVYVTRILPGVAYGQHHLEDLVQALRHSGAAWAQSPPRFRHEPGVDMVLEQPGLVLEGTWTPSASDRASAALDGRALWYAKDGTDGPPSGPAYQHHGCNAVLLPSTRGRAPVHLVHRKRPAQLAWFAPDQPPPAVPTHRSYFARASSGAASSATRSASILARASNV